jgi:hypothetical protein
MKINPPCLAPNSGGTGLESPPELGDLAAVLFGGNLRIKKPTRQGASKPETKPIKLVCTQQLFKRDLGKFVRIIFTNCIPLWV